MPFPKPRIEAPVIPAPAFAPRGDAVPGPYQTVLAPHEEQQFQSWVQANRIPWMDSPTSDYDMRGFWKGAQTGDPEARTELNPDDHRIHYSDKWKTPYHKSFSNESIYATPAAPRWQGNEQVATSPLSFIQPGPRRP